MEFDVRAGSHRLHAQRWGSPSAPLVLGLTGLGGTIKNFAFLGEHIAGDDLQLVALDWRGRGRSEATGAGTYGWENHARDVFGVADELGVPSFAIVGQSMGGSVAMKAAELDGARLRAVVLVDVAGRVDRGVGAVISSVLSRAGRHYASVDDFIGDVRTQALIEPWNEYWDRAYRYNLCEVDGGVRTRTDADAVAEDRAYTMTQDPYERWKYLTMPTLLLRATRELQPGSGFVVPADDRDRFARDVPSATVVEIDANHLTINTHEAFAAAIRAFLAPR
jgi:pimeloyl-ACP methyl ester carboxylesterase